MYVTEFPKPHAAACPFKKGHGTLSQETAPSSQDVDSFPALIDRLHDMRAATGVAPSVLFPELQRSVPSLVDSLNITPAVLADLLNMKRAEAYGRKLAGKVTDCVCCVYEIISNRSHFLLSPFPLVCTGAKQQGISPCSALLNQLEEDKEKKGLASDVQTDAKGNLKRVVWMEAAAVRRYGKINMVELFDTTYSVCFVSAGMENGRRVDHQYKLHVLVAINEHGKTEPVAWGLTRSEGTQDYHFFFDFVKRTTGEAPKVRWMSLWQVLLESSVYIDVHRCYVGIASMYSDVISYQIFVSIFLSHDRC